MPRGCPAGESSATGRNDAATQHSEETMSSTTTRRFHKAVPALLLALAVLVVGLAGTATAAKLITGKQIKNATITATDVKNGSLKEADLKKGVKAKRSRQEFDVRSERSAGDRRVDVLFFDVVAAQSSAPQSDAQERTAR